MRAWEADNGGEVGTEQMLGPERMTSDGGERLQKGGLSTSIWSGSAGDLRTQRESTDPFAKRRRLFCEEKKRRQPVIFWVCSVTSKATASSQETDVCLGTAGQAGHSSVRLASLSILPLKLLIEIQFLKSLLNFTSCLHRKIS